MSLICWQWGKRKNGWSRKCLFPGPFYGLIYFLPYFLFLYMKRLYFEGVFLTLCLFNSFKFWFNDNIYISAIVTSVIFSALHLQYTDFRTFLMLFLISLVLISAKIKSNGLLMPILLHMAMNAVITGIQYTLQYHIIVWNCYYEISITPEVGKRSK